MALHHSAEIRYARDIALDAVVAELSMQWMFRQWAPKMAEVDTCICSRGDR